MFQAYILRSSWLLHQGIFFKLFGCTDMYMLYYFDLRIACSICFCRHCRQVGFGVYAPARAQTQADYDAAIHSLFTGLDKVSYAVLHLHHFFLGLYREP